MNTNPQVEQVAILKYLQEKVQNQAIRIIQLEAELAKTNAVNDFHIKIIQDSVAKKSSDSDESICNEG